MKEEQLNERIYDLVEKFDFNDLFEKDKEYVLQHISHEEYDVLHSTINDTKKLFSKYPYQENKNNHFNLKKIAIYPIELYKIAAMVVLIIGISFFFFMLRSTKQSSLLAMVDTVVVKKTDTVFVEVRDTIVQLKEKIVYSKPFLSEKSSDYVSLTSKNITNDWDCSKELCPGDIRNLSAVKGNNSFSNDSALSDFIISTN